MKKLSALLNEIDSNDIICIGSQSSYVYFGSANDTTGILKAFDVYVKSATRLVKEYDTEISNLMNINFKDMASDVPSFDWLTLHTDSAVLRNFYENHKKKDLTTDILLQICNQDELKSWQKENLKRKKFNYAKDISRAVNGYEMNLKYLECYTNPLDRYVESVTPLDRNCNGADISIVIRGTEMGKYWLKSEWDEKHKKEVK